MPSKVLPELEHIVVVNDYANIQGGASQIAVTSAAALAAKVRRVTFFAGDGEPNPTLAGLKNVDVEVLGLQPFVDLPRREALTASVWNTAARRQLSLLLKGADRNTTIVHIHGYRTLFSSSVFGAALEAGFPTVYSAHDYSLGCPIGGFYNYRTERSCGKRGLSTACLCTSCSYLPYSRKLWACVRMAAQQRVGKVPEGLDHVIFVTEFSEKVLDEYLPRGVPSSVVENPVDAPEAARRELKPDAPFLFVGRYTAEKDPLTVARAGKATGLPVLFGGEGPLESEARQTYPAARFAGWLNGEGVREAMRSSRALIFPSKLMETQGLVVYEAAAQGLPVLVSDATAASGLIGESGGGLIFKAGDSEDLAAKMTALMNDQICEELSEKGYSHFWKRPPTMERHVQSLLSVYEAARRRRLGTAG